jgi:L-ribulose-5-phosphate 4-epimerase
MIPALAMVNVYWITFAPITSETVVHYDVSPLRVALLSMSFMIVYVFATFPASWLVDTKGFRVGVAAGALLIAVFGMLRGIYASNFTIVTIAQIGIAAGQPFLVNPITKVAARWFPVYERAMATGIATLAGYAGMVIAMVLTPYLFEALGGMHGGIERLLMIYGYLGIFSAVIFILFAREHPETPPGPGEELVHKLSLAEIVGITRNNNFMLLSVCVFVMMGIFNAVMTWVEDGILGPRGIPATQAGAVAGMMVAIGVVGALILPAMSDKLRKRQPFLVGAILASIPGFLGLTFSSDYYVLLASSAVMGFFILGVGPIAFQYGAEIAYPLPEGTSFGILMTMGQISGVIFIFGMDAFRSARAEPMTTSLYIFIFLMFAASLISTRLKESPLIQGAEPARHPDPEEIAKAKELVCRSGQRLLQSGLVSGTWGNISCRINDDYMAITPSGREYERMTPDDVVAVNLRDGSYESGLKPSSEKSLHVAIYNSRKEVAAVIHTHSASASAVAAARREVPPILDDMAQIIGPSVRVADYALPSTKKLVRCTMRALAGRNAALLANHGAICVGRDMDEAFVTCEVLEKSCRAFIEAEFLGGAAPINGIEARIMHEYYIRKYSKQKKAGETKSSPLPPGEV